MTRSFFGPERSAAERGLRDLDHLLRRAFVCPSQVRVTNGRLWLLLTDRGGGRVHVWVGPPDARPAWRVTARHAIGFDGGEQARGSRRALEVLYRVVCHLDGALPRSFQASEALPPTDSPPSVFPFVTIERSEREGSASTEILVRLTRACQESCPFCSAPPTHTPTGDEVRHALSALAELEPGALLSLTGGEPTLRPDFDELLAACLADTRFGAVQVQTNALRYARPGSARRQPPSDRLTFFVSLHALEETVFDACTGTRGLLSEASRGLDELLAAGHPVIVNAVVTRLNLAHLVEFAHRLASRVPRGARCELHFSTLIVPEYNPPAASLMVSYSELVPQLLAAADAARRRGLEVHSLRSSTHASMPECVLPAAERERGVRRPQVLPGETGYEGSTPWVKAEDCRACSRTDACLGVPRAYAASIGLGELRPLGVSSSAAHAGDADFMRP